MTRKTEFSLNTRQTLRGRAEEKLRDVHTDIGGMTAESVQRLVQELQIHQIELELQNQELRDVQAELADSRDRYADLYDFAPVGYITLDEHSRITESNLTAAMMIGEKRGGLLGKNIAKFIARDSQDAWYLFRQNLFSSGAKHACDIEMRRIDGIAMTVRLESIAFGSEQDRRCRTALIDITQKKKTEEKLEHLLSSERAARQEAEAATRAKDEFLAIVSHELRTPLTSILGWSRLLLSKDIEDSDRARALESIERNSRLQAQLVEDLLDISAMIAGKIHLEYRPVELAAMLTDAIDSVGPLADAKAIRIRTRFDANVGASSGDPQRLQQVIWNLLSNALKFTPEGGYIDVRLQECNSGIQIAVSDTGKGISSDFLPNVFDAFRQADAASTRKHGGLGLGLTIVRQIVLMHGGTVQASSAGEGKGATFTICLPKDVRRGEAPAASSSRDQFMETFTKRTVLNELNDQSLKGLRILVVDDEDDTLEMLTVALEHCRAEVRSRRDVAGALEVFQEWRPNLLISDIAMPDQDGYSLIAKVRELEKPRGERTVAMALTAYARMEDRTRVLDAGFDAFLTKPVDPDALCVALAAAWRDTHVRSQH